MPCFLPLYIPPMDMGSRPIFTIEYERTERTLVHDPLPLARAYVYGNLMKASSAAITLNLQSMSVKGSHLRHLSVNHSQIRTKSCPHIDEYVY